MGGGRLIVATSAAFALLLACTGLRTTRQAEAAAPPGTSAAPEGSVSEYYENGNIREQYTRINGQLQGQYLRYHPNGDLDISLFYKDNKPDGLYTWYYESGNHVRSTQVFTNGERNSPLTIYYRDGRIQHVLGYHNDVMEGEMISYYPNGQKQKELHIKHNGPFNVSSVGPILFYYENGQLSEAYAYADGKLNGAYHAYYPDGRLRREGQFTMGKRTGRWTTHEKDGSTSFYDYTQP